MEQVETNIERIAIVEGAQGTVGDLKIGAGDFYIANDELTCGLWFYNRVHVDLDRSERVRTGQVIEIGDYQVMVNGIEERSGRKYVFLTITDRHTAN
jgi:hypothetical protein